MPRRVRVEGDLFHGRVPASAIYVGRGAPGLPASPYANPHKVGACRCGRTHDQDGVVVAFREDFVARPDLLEAARRELVGHDLACWCKEDRACHVDVLLDLVNHDNTSSDTNMNTFADASAFDDRETLMDNVTNQADLAVLYAAAGIDPGLSVEKAAEHLAQLVAENTRLADAVDRQTRLSKMSIDQGALEIDVIPTREVVIAWILAARDLLGDAENYGETPVELPPSVELGIGTAGERYTVTVQRPGKLTPHEARRQAEAERDRIRDAVLALADEQDQADAGLLAQRLREFAGKA